MKKFKVEVSRKVVQSAKIEIETTSSYKARAIAEYKANNNPIDYDWVTEEPTEPVRINSKVTGSSSTGE